MIDLCKRCHYTCVEALNNFILHSKSILYIKSVWAPSDIVDRHNYASSHHHHHNRFPIFWRADWIPRWLTCANDATAEALNNFRLHPTSILNICKVVWAPSDVVDRHMDASSHHHYHKCCLQFLRAGWNPSDWHVQTMPVHVLLILEEDLSITRVMDTVKQCQYTCVLCWGCIISELPVQTMPLHLCWDRKPL